jgi:Domain of unknown function (DUF1772)
VDTIGFATLVVTGFTSCAEFGSFAFVHPVIRRLPQRQHLDVEQRLLRTFGRVMPFLMTACVILGIANASRSAGEGGPAIWRWLAAASFAAALASTLAFNVLINLATARWDPASPPPDWKRVRNRWELFQGIRSSLLLIGFVLASVGFAIG